MNFSFDRLDGLELKSDFTTLDFHAAGAPLRLVIDGLSPISGDTMQDKFQFLLDNCIKERNFLMREPRGHSGMVGAIVTQAVRPDSEFGLVFMSPSEFWGMCGHGVIAAVTAMIKLGELKLTDSRTGEIQIDTLFGPIAAYPKFAGDKKVESVTIKNVPSFHRDSIEINLKGFSHPVEVDIGYGGGFVGIVQAEQLSLGISPRNLTSLKKYAKEIMTQLSDISPRKHPEYGKMPVNTIRIVEREGMAFKNAMFFENGAVDRSPCGTGTSAHMAVEYLKGGIKLGEKIEHKSIIGTTFQSELIEKKTQWGIRTVVPTVTGSAFMTGVHRFILENDDPLPSGFQLNSEWKSFNNMELNV